MDYEKLYKEALSKAKDVYTYYSDDTEQLRKLEGIFPELKESEDERIREEIIDYLKSFIPHHDCDLVSKSKVWISWLEKQGVQKPFDYDIKEALRTEYEKGRADAIAEMQVAWSEKQGEQKPADKVESKFKVKYAGSEYSVFETKDIAGVTFYGIEDEPNHIDYVKAENCDIISGYAIKENGSPYPTKSAVFSEQKPADKVEPRFNVGDWIVFNGLILYIKEVIKGYYRTISKGGITNSYDWNIDNVARLWTIQDAKDGDVLAASDNSLFIFAKVKDNAACYHFSLCKNGSKEISDGNHTWEIAKGCHPATKKQSDFLFKKMKEAGYKLDKDFNLIKT